MSGLSDHEDAKQRRLPNWGAWGRQDTCKPDPERGSSSIYQMGKQDETDRDEDAGPTEVPLRIDAADAEIIDGWLRQLCATDLHVIRRKYYLRLPVPLLDLDASVRALLDLMADNRRVVDRMRYLRW